MICILVMPDLGFYFFTLVKLNYRLKVVSWVNCLLQRSNGRRGVLVGVDEKYLILGGGLFWDCGVLK